MDQTVQRWDTLFRNALVFDGTGAPPRLADVAVKDGRIAAMEPGLPLNVLLTLGIEALHHEHRILDLLEHFAWGERMGAERECE